MNIQKLCISSCERKEIQETAFLKKKMKSGRKSGTDGNWNWEPISVYTVPPDHISSERSSFTKKFTFDI